MGMAQYHRRVIDGPDALRDDAGFVDEEAAAEDAAVGGAEASVASAGREAGASGESGEVPLLTNGQLAQVFHDIGDLLEVKGELVFKTVAYHRAEIGRAHV